MPDPVDALILDLLEWIGPRSRPYREVIEAWRTSCPRLPVWEEANERRFIEYHHSQGSEAVVSVSALGAKFLAERMQIIHFCIVPSLYIPARGHATKPRRRSVSQMLAICWLRQR